MIEPLPWDSDHFGFPIARASADVAAEDVAAADEAGTRCVYLLADAGDPTTVRAAEDLGFRVVDIRLTLTRPAAGGALAPDVRPAVGDDLPELEEIAATAHEDSRFFADPAFDREAAAGLYRRWMRASVLEGFADLVLVAERDGHAGGYITGKREGDVFHIGLLAVAESLRGQGMGRALVDALVASAHERDATTVSVVTQGRNLHSQRLYQAAGFRTSRTELWLHRWAPGAAGLR